MLYGAIAMTKTSGAKLAMTKTPLFRKDLAPTAAKTITSLRRNSSITILSRSERGKSLVLCIASSTLYWARSGAVSAVTELLQGRVNDCKEA